MNRYRRKPSKGKRIILVVTLILVLLIISLGGFYVGMSYKGYVIADIFPFWPFGSPKMEEHWEAFTARIAEDITIAHRQALINSSISRACADIGINYQEIKGLEQTGEWIYGSVYHFGYKDMLFKVNVNEDTTVNSINLGGLKLYSQGLTPISAENYLVTQELAANMRICAIDAISSYFSGSAEQGGEGESEQNGGEAQARFIINERWGFCRYNEVNMVSGSVLLNNKPESFYIEFIYDDEGYVPIYMTISGQTVIGTESELKIERTELPIEQQPGIIELIDGVKGSYGELIDIDGIKYYRYIVPQGDYLVRTATKNARLFLDKNTGELQNIATLEFADIDEMKKITVNSGECIEITADSKFTLIQAE